MIKDLGPLFAAARPESEALFPTYKKLDETRDKLAESAQELYLIQARLETCDQSALRNFYWMVAGNLVLVALSAVFLILVFV